MEGISLYLTVRPDLIILDLGVPDMDGVGVCRSIRRGSKVPVVVLGARHDEAEKARLSLPKRLTLEGAGSTLRAP